MFKELLLIPSAILAFAIPSVSQTLPSEVSHAVIETNGCSSKSLSAITTLDLNACSESEIRLYYSSLNNLSEDKRSGITALQYLKPILYEMNYFTYDAVGDIYSITERDWEHSPNIASGNYNVTTKLVTNFKTSAEADSNPYIKMLYVDYSKVETTPLHKDNGNNNFDKEHVWCQSRGFKASSGAQGPAGTDLHHLIAGDSYVNQSVHNNNPYGYVSSKNGQGNLEYTSANIKGSQKHTSEKDQSTVVFEPMDEWKGDIARAIFYMMARYNNISGHEEISKYEPNLIIENFATDSGNAVESTADTPVGMGILSDSLAWNKLDPVDEFEIYRNDLIYRNYQGNRNPFIDFPDWIDAIWGTSNSDGSNYDATPKGVLNPATDKINSSTKRDDSNTPSQGSEFKFEPWMIAVAAGVAGFILLVIIIVVIIYFNSSKKNQKKMQKAGKKIVKSITKSTKSSSKSSSKKSSSKKK